VSTPKDVTFEALCSALYRLPFAEHLGGADERYDNDVSEAQYFHVGERPKDMRVTVLKPQREEMVNVRVQWKNYAADARHPLQGQQNITVLTSVPDLIALQEATAKAIERVLQIYTDVLEEKGVAGLGPLMPVDPNDDEDDES